MKIKNNKQENWDLVITPRRDWWDLRLKEVWHYRDLVVMFVVRGFAGSYKQTILGPLWMLIKPLMTSVVFTVIFGNIAALPTDGLPQFLFYMSGNVVWGYFSDCLVKTSDTFVTNANIFGKVYFPRLVMPISVLISNLMTFVIQFLLFTGFLIYFMLNGTDVRITAWAATLPLLLALMAGMGLGFGIIISSLTTKYRDMRYLLSFGVSLWMYATPVIYPVSTIPTRWQWVAQINPITPIIETFRMAFLGAGNATTGGLLYSAGMTAVVFLIGVMIFNSVEKNFIDTV